MEEKKYHKKKHNHDEINNKSCDCDSECKCGCNEGQECHCHDEECNCNDDGCHCHDEECHCEDNCECGCQDSEKADLYLKLAQQLQAEFENYRKRSYFEIERARQNGLIDAVKALLPAVDSIKKAKSMYKDETLIKGFDMMLDSIENSFKTLDIEPIKALGEKLDVNLHNVVAVVKTENADDNIIVEEYQTGYKLKDKIIRYSQVIVNKKGE